MRLTKAGLVTMAAVLGIGCTETVTIIDGRAYPTEVVSLAQATGEGSGLSRLIPPGFRQKRSQIRNWSVESAGPRIGMIYIGGAAGEALIANEMDPVMSAWGWQFEYQYKTDEEGPTGLIEFVPLIAGLEQGEGFPSLNVLFGLRTPKDHEFCIGPNASHSGVGLTVALGHTFRMGSMSMPVNAAVVSNRDGLRYSLTFGWNL